MFAILQSMKAFSEMNFCFTGTACLAQLGKKKAEGWPLHKCAMSRGAAEGMCWSPYSGDHQQGMGKLNETASDEARVGD